MVGRTVLSEGQPSSQAQAWSQVWPRALLRPSLVAFKDIVSRPDVTTHRAYSWVFLSALLSGVMMGVAGLILPDSPLAAARQVAGLGPLLAGIVMLAPIGAFLAVLTFMFEARVTQALARRAGGAGAYPHLTFAMAAYRSPLLLASGVIEVVPPARGLATILGLYGLFLDVLAVRAVHDLNWSRAVLSCAVVIALNLLPLTFPLLLQAAGVSVPPGPPIPVPLREILLR